MQKKCQYIGIFSKNEVHAKQVLMAGAEYALAAIQSKYQGVQVDYKQYNFPPSIHCTSLFVGGSAKLLNHEAYTNFKEGLEQPIVVHGVAISPGNIVTSILSKDYEVPIANQYAHITTLLGSWKAKDSNELLEETFKQLNYEEFCQPTKQDKVWCIEGNLKKSASTFYVVQFKDKLILEGITKIV